MGDFFSCTSSKPPPIASRSKLNVETYQIPLAQLDDCLKPQLLILPAQYEYFKSNMEERLREDYQTMIVFKNRQELQEYKNDSKNNILVVGCRTPEDAYTLHQLTNFHTFSLIGVACIFNLANPLTIKETCQAEMGFRLGDVFPYKSNEIVAFMEQASKGRSIYFFHNDTGHIYRTHLAFDCFFGRSQEYSPSYFYEWAKRTPEGSELVSIIETKSKKDVGNFIVRNIFSENSALLKAIEQLRLTKNPGIMAHTAWLFSTLFDFIFQSYAKTKQQLREKNRDQFVVWLPLTKTEVEILEQISKRKLNGKQKNPDCQNFIFPVFMIGYSNVDFVPALQTSQNLYKFFINIPPDLESYDQNVDLGFFFDQNKVIFNIQNIYRMDKYDKQDRTIYATYCSIGRQYNFIKQDSRHLSNAHSYDTRMIKMYDYFTYVKSFIHNQLDLCFTLQYYHQYKKILTNTFKLIADKDSITTNNSLSSTVNSIKEDLHPSKYLLQKIGDAQLLTGNYAEALASYELSKRTLRAYLKKLRLNLVYDNKVAFKQTLQQLKKYKEDNKITYLNNFEGVAINNFLAMMTQRQGNYSLALSMIKECLQMCKQIYLKRYKQLHEQTYDIFPLFYMARTTKALIETKKGENTAARDQQDLKKIKPYFKGVHMFWLPQ